MAPKLRETLSRPTRTTEPVAAHADASHRPGHLLVWVGNNPHAEALVQQAARLAGALHVGWTAICVGTPNTSHALGAPKAPALRALRLAESLGASVDMVHAASVLEAIVERVRRDAATTVLIGDHPANGWVALQRRQWPSGLADALSTRLPGVTVQSIHFPAPDNPAPPMRADSAGAPLPRQGWLRALLVVGLCTVVSELLLPYTERATLITVYLVGVVYVALRLGQSASLLAVVASIVAFDLLVVAPRWSLVPLDPQYYFTFLVMLVVGVLICRLVARAALQTELAEARARRAHALSELARQLVSAQHEADIGDGLAAALQSTFNVQCLLLLPDEHGQLRDASAVPAAAEDLQRAQQLFDWAHAAALPPQYPGDLLPQVLLHGSRATLGVLAVRPPAAGIVTPEDHSLLQAMANQAALALERTLFERRSAQAGVEAETERLRNTLLSAISHDFRTPLTTIIGAASSLLQQEHALDREGRRALLEGLLGEARRVHASMSDLLDLSRMEEGHMLLAFEWCPVDDLLQEVREVLGERLQQHALQWQAPGEAIVWCDPRLVVQATVNLLDNAVRHTPQGGPIRVQVSVIGGHWLLSVADGGPGLAPGQEHEVFKKFARGRGEVSGGGTGLGLAICAAVARLHQGQIEVHSDGGACFTLRLPQPSASATLATDAA